jgi:hypothetical protein
LKLITRQEADFMRKHYPEIDISMSGQKKKAHRKRYFCCDGHPLFSKAEEEFYSSLVKGIK